MAKIIILAIYLITDNPAYPTLHHYSPLSRSYISSFNKGRFERKTFTVIATSYCLRGRTATGTKPKIGTVAVDPRIIPLGSILYIEGYGWARAEDTGSAIKGKRVDVWLPSRSQALKWGVRKVKVTVFIPIKKNQ